MPRGWYGPLPTNRNQTERQLSVDLDRTGSAWRSTTTSAAANAGHLPQRGCHFSRSRTRSG